MKIRVVLPVVAGDELRPGGEVQGGVGVKPQAGNVPLPGLQPNQAAGIPAAVQGLLDVRGLKGLLRLRERQGDGLLFHGFGSPV